MTNSNPRVDCLFYLRRFYLALSVSESMLLNKSLIGKDSLRNNNQFRGRLIKPSKVLLYDQVIQSYCCSFMMDTFRATINIDSLALSASNEIYFSTFLLHNLNLETSIENELCSLRERECSSQFVSLTRIRRRTLEIRLFDINSPSFFSYQICKFIFDCSTGIILFTKSTPRTVANWLPPPSLVERERERDIPTVAPISVRKSLPAIKRCNDVLPTSVSPRRRTLYLTSNKFSWRPFGIARRRWGSRVWWWLKGCRLYFKRDKEKRLKKDQIDFSRFRLSCFQSQSSRR